MEFYVFDCNFMYLTVIFETRTMLTDHVGSSWSSNMLFDLQRLL